MHGGFCPGSAADTLVQPKPRPPSQTLLFTVAILPARLVRKRADVFAFYVFIAFMALAFSHIIEVAIVVNEIAHHYAIFTAITMVVDTVLAQATSHIIVLLLG